MTPWADIGLNGHDVQGPLLLQLLQQGITTRMDDGYFFIFG